METTATPSTPAHKALGATFVGLGFVTFIVLFITVGAVIRGFLLMVLWNWFVTPALGFAAITVPAAIGLGLVGAAILGYRHKDTPKGEVGQALLGGLVIQPILLLAIGWVVKHFV